MRTSWLGRLCPHWVCKFWFCIHSQCNLIGLLMGLHLCFGNRWCDPSVDAPSIVVRRLGPGFRYIGFPTHHLASPVGYIMYNLTSEPSVVNLVPCIPGVHLRQAFAHLCIGPVTATAYSAGRDHRDSFDLREHCVFGRLHIVAAVAADVHVPFLCSTGWATSLSNPRPSSMQLSLIHI